jgi:hypothetical protein
MDFTDLPSISPTNFFSLLELTIFCADDSSASPGCDDLAFMSLF